MENPYATPKHVGEHAQAPIGGPSRSQDVALVRTWLGQSGLVILGITGSLGALTSLLLDLQAFYAPDSGASMLGLLNSVLMILVSVVAIHIAVGRWRDPQAPLGPIINRGFSTGGRVVLPVILRGLISLVGLVLFIVPGVIFAMRTLTLEAMFALGYREEGVKTLKGSWDRSEGQLGDLFVLLILGAMPLLLMSFAEGVWQYVAYEEGLGFGVLLAVSLPLAFVRSFVSVLLPLLGAARVISWIQEDQGELVFPWEKSAAQE